MESTKLIKRLNLGYEAELGYLYDIQDERFCSSNSTFSETCLTSFSDNNYYVTSNLLIGFKIRHKIDVLNIQRDLWLKLLTKFFLETPFIRYLMSIPDVPEDPNIIQATFKLEMNTRTSFIDKLNFDEKKLSEYKFHKPTHVVVEIKYGFILIINLKYFNPNKLPKEVIYNQFFKIKENILNLKESLEDIDQNIQNNLLIDCFESNEYKNYSFKGLSNLMELIKNISLSKNHRPIEYTFAPLNDKCSLSLRMEPEMQLIEQVIDYFYFHLDEIINVYNINRRACSFTEVFDDAKINMFKANTNSIWYIYHDLKSYVREWKRNIYDFKRNKNDNGQIFHDFKKLLIELKPNFKKIEDLLKDVSYFLKFEIKIAGKNEHLKELLLGNDTILFCFSEELKEKHLNYWKKCYGEFLYLNKQNSQSNFIVVIYDICEPVNILKDQIYLFHFIDNEFKNVLPYKIENKTNIKNMNENKNNISEFKNKNETKELETNDNQKEIKDINIVLLGETGVGKSTFINAFYNYTTHKSLDEAEKESSVLSLIGSVFAYQNDDYKIETVKIGNDENECTKAGQSSTQKAKAHKFQINNKTINIIDTPGMGDVRGIEVDKKNFEQTVEYLSQFKHLNSICFLLKPNNIRLSPGFRYCFKELFSHLHKDTVKNICFIFTNSRSTQYRPGDTLPALKNYIKEIGEQSDVNIPFKQENIFCMDNEAFRYLVLIKNNISLPNQTRNNYFDSWKESAKSVYNLINYIEKLSLISTKDTILLNRFREIQTDWSIIAFDLIKKISCKKNLQNEKGQENTKSINNTAKNKLAQNYNLIMNQIKTFEIQLINICSHLSNLSQKNAISVFNDNFEAYLDEHCRNVKKSSIFNPKQNYSNNFEQIYNNYLSKRKQIQSDLKNEKLEFNNNSLNDYFNQLLDLKDKFDGFCKQHYI